MLDIFSKNLVEFIAGMPLTLSCSDKVFNPKACGVQGRSPGGVCGGTKPPVHKKKLKKKFSTKKTFKIFYNIFSKNISSSNLFCLKIILPSALFERG